MTANPFHQQVDDALVGQQVRVQTPTTAYEGWLQIREYNKESLLLVDAVRDDGEPVGEIAIYNPISVNRAASSRTVQRVTLAQIQPSPYTQRSFDTANFRAFVRTLRQRGHLTTFPLVRPIDDGHFELVSGHRRCEAARQAGLKAIAAEVTTLSDWEATATFLDEHVPTCPQEAREATDPHSGFYQQPQLDAAIEQLQADWPQDRLRDHPALGWYLAADEPYPTHAETGEATSATDS